MALKLSSITSWLYMRTLGWTEESDTTCSFTLRLRSMPPNVSVGLQVFKDIPNASVVNMRYELWELGSIAGNLDVNDHLYEIQAESEWRETIDSSISFSKRTMCFHTY